METRKGIIRFFKPKNKKTGKRKPFALFDIKGKISVWHGGRGVVRKFDKEKSMYETDRYGNKVKKNTRDFGYGFYTTVKEEHAKSIIVKNIELKNDRYGIISYYEFDYDSAKHGLKIKIYDKPDREWFKFVLDNRGNMDFQHDWDIVIGPTADLSVVDACIRYTRGLDFESAYQMTVGKDNVKDNTFPTQIFFHNEKAFGYLKLIKWERYDGRKR